MKLIEQSDPGRCGNFATFRRSPQISTKPIPSLKPLSCQLREVIRISEIGITIRACSLNCFCASMFRAARPVNALTTATRVLKGTKKAPDAGAVRNAKLLTVSGSPSSPVVGTILNSLKVVRFVF